MARNDTLLLLAALLLLGGGGYVAYTGTRGLRNNNPGNIRYDGTAWEGLADPPSDGTFCVFTDPVYGIRAMAHILTRYISADGVQPTVTGLISRWAPPSENDTASYIADVSGRLAVAPNASLDLSSYLPELVSAIIAHENFYDPYDPSVVAQGVSMA